MKAFLKKNYRYLILGLAAIAAGISLCVSFMQRGADGVSEPEEVRIGSDTHVERIIHFDACSHEMTKAMDAGAYLGYTRADMAAHFPESSILCFDKDTVRLMQVRSGYCPKHYILRLRADGVLGVTRTDDTFCAEELVALVPEESAQLPSADRKSLESGLAFDTLSDIDAYLESMGS